MNIPRYSVKGFAGPALLVVCLTCSTAAGSSSGGAIVRNDMVPLYSEMSADSRVNKSLRKGEQVIVDVEIAGPEGAWCGIVEQGQTSVAGYVYCEELERPLQKDLWQHVGSTAPEWSNEAREAGEMKVEVEGNHVFVPVTMEYKGTTVNGRLVLDTGASVTMINTDMADRLGIDPAETVEGKGQVVGGMVISAAFARLGYVSVGPHTKRNMVVSIIEERNLRERRDGLLGMDFLRGLKYYVDFKSGVIRWGD